MNAELADKVQAAVEIARAHQQDPLGSDDYLVTKTCILLDPVGPIRYKGFSFMPEGFGAALALEVLHNNEAQIPAEVLARDIPSIWLGQHESLRPNIAALERIFCTLRMYLQSTEMGQGIERCLYVANPGLSCQSPLIVKDHVIEVRRLLHALDEAAKRIDTKTRPVDRHIAAFIAARSDQDVSSFMRILTSGSEQSATLAMLSMLSMLQARERIEELFALSNWVGGHLGPVIMSYRSKTTRQEIERAIPRVVRLGSLPQLLDLVDNATKRQRDTDDFTQAEAQVRSAQAEIDRIESDDASHAKEMDESGQHAAAMVLVVLTMIIIAIIFSVKTW